MHNRTWIDEHLELTRRYFLRCGLAVAGAAAWAPTSHCDLFASEQDKSTPAPKRPKAGAMPDPYFTAATEFRDVSRGKPIPHTLSEEKRKQVGLTRDTWQLEVISDTEHPAKINRPLTKANSTALDFDRLLKLGETHSVRFAKVMTCLNLGCPLGMGLWEGVPLREVVWLTEPQENLRRVFYFGYHNDDPKQIFRSSLPIGRVLEDPFDLPPVILCYKLNGEWLDAERGGPVRMIVPEAYGFKSVKWLTHVVLTNLAYANDTYAEQNNDVDSSLKTFSATLSIPTTVRAGEPIPVSGYAQVGISGLRKVQVLVEPKGTDRPVDDPTFTRSAWKDAELLPAPTRWNTLLDEKIPTNTHGFDENGVPKSWPLRLTNSHWATVLAALPAGEYTFRSRTIDEKGIAQPQPRPFRKSGHAAIESIDFVVTP